MGKIIKTIVHHIWIKLYFIPRKEKKKITQSSVQFSHSVMSDFLQPHGLHHARLLCPSPTLRVYSNGCPLNRWCHPAISSSVVPFFSCLQSFPASVSFPMSQLFASSGQSTGASASASVLPRNIQGWFPLGLTGLLLLFSHSVMYLCDRTDGSMPGFPVPDYILEFAQTHVHWVDGTI